MYALATTTVTILRGTKTDELGDEIDTYEPYQTGIIASLIEKNHTTWDRATQLRRTVRIIACTLPSTTDVTSDDRIVDEETGYTYSIVDVTQPNAVGITPDLDLELKRITGATA
jgi:hypothetical protein